MPTQNRKARRKEAGKEKRDMAQATDNFKCTIMVTPEDAKTEQSPPKLITFGMFPQLLSLNEDDFKSVEWRRENIEL